MKKELLKTELTGALDFGEEIVDNLPEKTYTSMRTNERRGVSL